ncbi:helix-turn-helix domain-containing protein [Halalkalibacter lacteus]|uniref:helix-turn-helix domain-containing protein n=1 Tax=Halalkalibacter lacteus TaxID=3090663 RepID=UPI002FCC4328
MQMYSVDEAFELLKQYKITTHKESVRRWLRQGVIKAKAPISRKEGWQIPKEALDAFVQERLPDSITTSVVKEASASKTTNIAKEDIERIREEMWIELANKQIWEGFLELRKTRIRECIEHRRYPRALEKEVWKACQENSKAYSKPRVFYLLEAFGFDGQRLLLDQNFDDREEQIIFSIIEYVRTKKDKVSSYL